MIRSILIGALFKAPETKTAASGKTYTVASMAIDASEGQPRFARLTAFGDAAERLAGMAKGAALSVTGRLEVSIWQPEGKPPQPALQMVVDEILPLTATPKRRAPPDSGARGAAMAFYSGGQQ